MSEAKRHYERALEDVKNIMWFHSEVGGADPGKRSKEFQSLNKSAVVLLCAAWETYVETVIEEAVKQIVNSKGSASELPKAVSKLVHAKLIKSDHQMEWHTISGDGWKKVVKDCAREEVERLNTPKTQQVQDLFKKVLGVSDITENWEWHKNKVQKVRLDLSTFVELRGGIAHGEKPKNAVTKATVDRATDLLN